MPIPQPKVALTDVCSVIFNNTLYTYSADAFQSLPLTAGAQWTTLPQGEAVTGGVCVGSTPGDASTAGLFVVGGKGTSAGYQGVQKFTYSTGQWESITLPMPVTQDRLWHGAVYINSSDSILVYAGAQDGSKNPSTQTFTIGASAPHQVLAYESIAPPTTNPILLPWSDSEAVLIGGSTTNTKIMLFSPATAWVDSGATLAEPLMKDITAVRAVIMTGDDGSKNLYTFDMTETPNAVNRTVLYDASGAPVQKSAPVSRRTRIRRRDASTLTLSDWPVYNATLAPTSTRTNYALAEDSNGLVVIAGGNQDDILCMFDARENGWQNATARFTQQKVLSAGFSSTSSLSSSATTSTASASTLPLSAATVTAGAAATAAPASSTDGSSSGPGTNTILAAVLSSIFGLAIILFGLYWCIQRQRRRQAHLEAGHSRRQSGASSSEKDGVGFASDSLPHKAPAGAGVFRNGHQTQDSQSSFSSMAILMGRINQHKSEPKSPGLSLNRNPSHHTSHSRNSSVDSTFKAFKSTISKPIPHVAQREIVPVPQLQPPPQPQPQPELQTRDEKGVSFAPNTQGEPRQRNPASAVALDRKDGSTRRSSGWNRYWSGGSALNILGFGNGNNGNGGNGGNNKRTTATSEQSSRYSGASDDTHMHRITQDSATVPPLQVYDYEPRASFSRVNSGSPTIAHFNNDRLQPGMRGKIETHTAHEERPVSLAVSELSEGGYSSGIPASVHEAWDPTDLMASKPWGTDRAPSSAYSSVSTYTTPLAPASYSSSGGANSARQAAQQPPKPQQQQQQPVMRDDMSWLNLGDHGR
ncbi:hypothetical protein QBC46DRAFT_115039 [Diplogelasinospora grovesii]|uniref:Pre-mRNA splicing factor CLF1 n=1 Tax=Diplogelasinospora grovesii TaxID=303347 RepID=A0AAN6S8T1_9PEZI|nr:hypothetical protein QBC46DRAFT_115039 [Diplogelasinospora grovesii]